MTIVSGQVIAPAGVLPQVTFGRTAAVVDPVNDLIALPDVLEAVVMSDGTFSIDLLPARYVVRITAGLKTFPGWATISGGEVDLADVLELGPQPEMPEQLLRASQLGEPDGVAPLDGDGLVPVEHVPALDYVPVTGGTVTGGLTVDGVLAVGEAAVLEIGADTNLYRTGLNQLATDDGLAVGGNLKVYGGADIDGSISGQVVDDTFVIRKGDWSAALRLRSTGGAVDIDLAGTVVISSFAGVPEDVFGGEQTGLLRLRAGSGVTLAGLTEFGPNEYSGAQAIDGDGGVARLGAKNGLGNIRLAGLKATAGAPTTDTWETGDVVLDSAGAWHLCTAGGEPGVWT